MMHIKQRIIVFASGFFCGYAAFMGISVWRNDKPMMSDMEILEPLFGTGVIDSFTESVKKPSIFDLALGKPPKQVVSTIYINGEQLGRAEIAVIAKLRDLDELIIGGGELASSLLDSFDRNINMRSIRIRGSVITRSGIHSVINKFPFLENLDVTDSMIRDDALESLQLLSSLRVLNLSNTSIGDRGVRYAARCPHLEILKINNLSISDSEVDAIKKSYPLVHIVKE